MKKSQLNLLKTIPKWLKVIILLLLCIAIWFIGGKAFIWHCPFFANFFGPTENLENIFAPVTSLFSAISTFAIIATIYYQIDQFRTQQVEFRIQQVENIFFNLLSIHRENINQIVCVCESDSESAEKWPDSFLQTKTSQAAIFEYYFRLLKNLYTCVDRGHQDTETFNSLPAKIQKEVRNILESSLKEDGSSGIPKEDTFKNAYKIFDDYAHQNLTHYHVHLYHLIKYTDTNVRDENTKKQYMALIRAQFSTFSHLLFYYNGLANTDGQTDNGTSKIKKLIEDNRLLHNLRRDLLFDNKMAGTYNESAFGDS